MSDHHREASRSDNHIPSQGEYTPCFILTGLTTSKAITRRSAEGRLIRQPRGPHNPNITQYSEPGKCDHHCRRQYYSDPENYGGPSYIVNWATISRPWRFPGLLSTQNRVGPKNLARFRRQESRKDKHASKPISRRMHIIVEIEFEELINHAIDQDILTVSDRSHSLLCGIARQVMGNPGA